MPQTHRQLFTLTLPPAVHEKEEEEEEENGAREPQESLADAEASESVFFQDEKERETDGERILLLRPAA